MGIVSVGRSFILCRKPNSPTGEEFSGDKHCQLGSVDVPTIDAMDCEIAKFTFHLTHYATRVAQWMV
jgi:hypothetical protein